MKQHARKNSAFTLIEIMVVVVIIGILAAAIIPQVIGTTEDAKVNTAKADVSQLENALERFNLNLDRYPTTVKRGPEGLRTGKRPPGEEARKMGCRCPTSKFFAPTRGAIPTNTAFPAPTTPPAFDLWVHRRQRGASEVGNWQ